MGKENRVERKEVREARLKGLVGDGVIEMGPIGVPGIFYFTLEHNCCTTIYT
jgi:hypothetical protein